MPAIAIENSTIMKPLIWSERNLRPTGSPVHERAARNRCHSNGKNLSGKVVTAEQTGREQPGSRIGEGHGEEDAA